MQMFLNSKPALESDLKTAFAALDELDTIELVRVDERGNLYFEVHTFELMSGL
jgi:hypothetical protein